MSGDFASRFAEARQAWSEDAEAQAEQEAIRDEGNSQSGSSGPISARDLLAKAFPALRWAIPGLFPEGLAILAGRPKIGKSWLALLIALAVACGRSILGRTPAVRGGVLYVALEDSPRRIQKRLLALGATPAPEGLYFLFQLPRIGARGLDVLEAWLAEHPDVLLVVIDTFSRIKDARGKNADAYAHDAEQAGLLQALAARRGVSLLVVHHDRKLGADDWLERISGTLALTGSADAVSLLERERNSANGRLRVTGRDLEEEADLSLEFRKGEWVALGPGEEFGLSPERRRLLAALRQYGPMGPQGIAKAAGLTEEMVKRALREMKRDGLVSWIGRGQWKAL